MKGNIIKDICCIPLKFAHVFKFIELILGKVHGGYIIGWHDISAELFKSQVEALFPSKPIPLEELVKRYKTGKSTKGCFAITFDDGVGTTVRDISELCVKMGWPVTFYIPTDYLDGEPLPYQKVKIYDKYLPTGKYQMENINKKIKNATMDKATLIKFITNALYKDPLHEINSMLDCLLPKLSVNENITQIYNTCPQPISWTEVEKLSKNSIISFQSHGVSHTALSSLNNKEIENEMIKSKRIIEEHTNKKVNSFCYPYGNKIAIGNHAPKIAANHYDYAVTLIRSRLRESDIFSLPRIDLYSSDSNEIVKLKVISS